MIKIYFVIVIYIITIILLIAFGCWKILLALWICGIIWLFWEIKHVSKVPKELDDLF